MSCVVLMYEEDPRPMMDDTMIGVNDTIELIYPVVPRPCVVDVREAVDT
jgi:hypothetical protein